MLSSLLSGSPKLVEVRIAILDTETFCLIRCVVFSLSYTFWITICWNFLASSKGKKIIFLEKEEEKTFFIRMCTKRIKYTLKSWKRHYFPTWFSCEKTLQINFFTATGQVYETQIMYFWIHFYIIEAVGIILPICLVKMS